MWSAIGLVIALGFGWSTFARFLAGAKAMDEHTRTAECTENMPMMMALLELWNTRYLNTETHLFYPTRSDLSILPTSAAAHHGK